jgi:hypothetical protein
MSVSKATAKAIIQAVRKHVTKNQMQAIMLEIEQVDGNQSFKDSISLMREQLEKKK